MSEQLTFRVLEDSVRVWADRRGIPEKSTAKDQLLKAVEEMGELSRGVQKHDLEMIEDAIGDVVVCLVNLARFYDLRVEECFDVAHDVIQTRSGSMVNGVFVKEGA